MWDYKQWPCIQEPENVVKDMRLPGMKQFKPKIRLRKHHEEESCEAKLT